LPAILYIKNSTKKKTLASAKNQLSIWSVRSS